jgi:hypothetical protein
MTQYLTGENLPPRPPGPAGPPGLSLRQAVRPAVFAHDLMAGNREGAARLAAECDELLQLTRELLHATGRAALLGADESSKDFSHNGISTPPHPDPDRNTARPDPDHNTARPDPDHNTARPDTLQRNPTNSDKSEISDIASAVKNRPVVNRGDYSPENSPQGGKSPHNQQDATLPSLHSRATCAEMSDLRSRGPGGPDGAPPGEEQLLAAYADAAMAWSKVAGALLALGGTLLDQGEWAAVRRLADVFADVGEGGLARDLRIRLGAAVFGAYREPLRRIGNAMPPAEIARGIDVLRAVLREVPEDFPDRDREVNRLLAPLAASVHKVMKARGIDAGFDSRVEHIASGGVAGYPEIVTTSLDELAAEFEGLYR